MAELIERRIIIGLIYSESFIRQINKIVRLEYFSTKESKTLARIAIDTYRKYEKPAGEDIVSLVYDRKDAELLLQFVDGITEDEKHINVDVLIDEAVEFFKRRSLENLASDIEMLIAGGRVDDAEKELKNYKPISKEVSLVIDPTDPEVVTTAFEYDEEYTVRFPGAFGMLVNDLFVRDGFVALMAPEKRGKTWFMVELGMRAWWQKLNVAFFEVGDMTKKKVLRRFYSWLMKAPVGSGGKKLVKVPELNCALHERDKCNLKIRERGSKCLACLKLKRKQTKFRPVISYFENEVEVATVDKVQSKVLEFGRKMGRGKLKLSVHSSGSLSVSEMNDILLTWKEVDGFVPDVIVIDYADILKDEGFGDKRDRINETWMRLRKLSQDWHCFVFTATQSDIKGHSTDVLTQANFSEDKRKLSHVTAMIGLNQKDDEKEKRIYRFNIIVAREKDYRVNEVVVVGYSFDIGRPYLFSYFE